ncbi:hypothetical protein CN97_00770 [Haematobacter massiliensis]|uniref:DUF2635 domain-containing protein n=1 Tax=Haematobacter massiliensis TaxID=195105 RepID=A0A086Y0E3_9RHOB|nr:hypothetical protein [Haematobacter massiliensis]KFI27743.1 hypothetical protein CN97_00770 [Haematobacter massiliensis]OWJ82716.1 hypothetical protein CDV51_17055 [Haematobacter massiliensis]
MAVRIRITKPGIFSAVGEVAVGAEIDMSEEPKAWAGRYEVVAAAEGEVKVATPPKRTRKAKQ